IAQHQSLFRCTDVTMDAGGMDIAETHLGRVLAANSHRCRGSEAKHLALVRPFNHDELDCHANKCRRRSAWRQALALACKCPRGLGQSRSHRIFRVRACWNSRVRDAASAYGWPKASPDARSNVLSAELSWMHPKETLTASAARKRCRPRLQVSRRRDQPAASIPNW